MKKVLLKLISILMFPIIIASVFIGLMLTAICKIFNFIINLILKFDNKIINIFN